VAGGVGAGSCEVSDTALEPAIGREGMRVNQECRANASRR
jgi:hypothetical protein